jgi:hypothetical protein
MAFATVPAIRQGWTCEDLCLDSAELTFIQVARGMAFYGKTLVLVDLAPTVPYLTTSAPILLGHISTGAFLDLWGSSREPPAVVPWGPGVLSLADPERSPLGDVSVLLARPRIHDTGFTYDVRLVEGTLPSSSGSCVLYVNARVLTEPEGVPTDADPERLPR